MVRKIQINFTNKWFYTFVVIIAVLVLGMGVYALVPSPGHDANEIGEGTIANTLTISGGNVGIGTSTPSTKLEVVGDVIAGSIASTAFVGDGSQITNIEVRVTGQAACDSTNDGLLRYRSALCSGDDIRSSFFDICVKTGSSAYGWKTVETNSWTDVSCDLDGCPVGENYYECTGEFVQPGCYSSRPANCYGDESFFDPCGAGTGTMCP
ncbi:MAG: hypothetical protein IIA85_01435 [Nanoarchaeota archaeon]|nr:hypothetical protein [Nanoarchaeota archaeon]